MTVVQLAETTKEVNQVAWGQLVGTAKAVIGYMIEHALGLVQAKTVEQITVGAAAWAVDNDLAGGYKKTDVPCILHKLTQGVAHAALRMDNGPIRFYVHTDYRQRLDEESEAAEAVHVQAFVSKPPPKPCVTRGCPYAGTWDSSAPADDGCKSKATFPEGPKCCGSCTGVLPDGRMMAAAHGCRCERLSWLGVPNIDPNNQTWLAITSPSRLNEELQKAFGTARLVENELPARVSGVSLEWSFEQRSDVHICQVSMAKDEGRGQWIVRMSGPTRAVAKLRAQMAFLHCYARLLEVARDGPPVNYTRVWEIAFNELLRAEGSHPAGEGDTCEVLADVLQLATSMAQQNMALALELANKHAESDGDSENASGNDSVAAAMASTPQPQCMPPGLSQGLDPGASAVAQDMSHLTVEGASRAAAHVQTFETGAAAEVAPNLREGSIPDIWGAGLIVTVPVPLRATRSMCAVARYETDVCALPYQQTNPATKIVPVSELRIALDQDRRTWGLNLGAFSDDQLLNAFVAEAGQVDARAHGGVRRFGRTTLNSQTMYPADQRSRSSLQHRGEPSLVVRMKRQG